MRCFIDLLGTVIIMAACAVTTALGNVIRVPEDYATLTAALADVQTLDTVLVGPGVFQGTDYYGDANSPVGVTLMGSGWPCGTILIAYEGSSVPSVMFLTHVQGWRVTNFEMMWADMGLRLDYTSGCEVDHNFVHDMIGDPSWGEPITGSGDVIELDIHHNLIARCDAGMFIGWEGNPGVTQNVRIYNNTIVDIWGYRAPYGLDALQFRAETPTGCQVVNNIIDGALGYGLEFAACNQNDTYVAYNCVIRTNGAWYNMQPGPGNIYLDPGYGHSGGFPEYFYLSTQSPCVDTGDPSFPLDPDGTRADIGAFASSQLRSPGGAVAPLSFSLDQNYPNPFNAITRISFNLPRDEQVALSVYSTQGRLVSQLLSGRLSAGDHVQVLDASDLATGLYFYRLSGSDFSLTRRMIVLK